MINLFHVLCTKYLNDEHYITDLYRMHVRISFTDLSQLNMVFMIHEQYLKSMYLFQCTVLSACGEECVIATKINTAVDK